MIFSNSSHERTPYYAQLKMRFLNCSPGKKRTRKPKRFEIRSTHIKRLFGNGTNGSSKKTRKMKSYEVHVCSFPNDLSSYVIIPQRMNFDTNSIWKSRDQKNFWRKLRRNRPIPYPDLVADESLVRVKIPKWQKW